MDTVDSPFHEGLSLIMSNTGEDVTTKHVYSSDPILERFDSTESFVCPSMSNDTLQIPTFFIDDEYTDNIKCIDNVELIDNKEVVELIIKRSGDNCTTSNISLNSEVCKIKAENQLDGGIQLTISNDISVCKVVKIENETDVNKVEVIDDTFHCEINNERGLGNKFESKTTEIFLTDTDTKTTGNCLVESPTKIKKDETVTNDLSANRTKITSPKLLPVDCMKALEKVIRLSQSDYHDNESKVLNRYKTDLNYRVIHRTKSLGEIESVHGQLNVKLSSLNHEYCMLQEQQYHLHEYVVKLEEINMLLLTQLQGKLCEKEIDNILLDDLDLYIKCEDNDHTSTCDLENDVNTHNNSNNVDIHSNGNVVDIRSNGNDVDIHSSKNIDAHDNSNDVDIHSNSKNIDANDNSKDIVILNNSKYIDTHNNSNDVNIHSNSINIDAHNNSNDVGAHNNSNGVDIYSNSRNIDAHGNSNDFYAHNNSNDVDIYSNSRNIDTHDNSKNIDTYKSNEDVDIYSNSKNNDTHKNNKDVGTHNNSKAKDFVCVGEVPLIQSDKTKVFKSLLPRYIKRTQSQTKECSKVVKEYAIGNDVSNGLPTDQCKQSNKTTVVGTNKRDSCNKKRESFRSCCRCRHQSKEDLKVKLDISNSVKIRSGNSAKCSLSLAFKKEKVKQHPVILARRLEQNKNSNSLIHNGKKAVLRDFKMHRRSTSVVCNNATMSCVKKLRSRSLSLPRNKSYVKANFESSEKKYAKKSPRKTIRSCNQFGFNKRKVTAPSDEIIKRPLETNSSCVTRQTSPATSTIMDGTHSSLEEDEEHHFKNLVNDEQHFNELLKPTDENCSLDAIEQTWLYKSEFESEDILLTEATDDIKLESEDMLLTEATDDIKLEEVDSNFSYEETFENSNHIFESVYEPNPIINSETPSLEISLESNISIDHSTRKSDTSIDHSTRKSDVSIDHSALESDVSIDHSTDSGFTDIYTAFEVNFDQEKDSLEFNKTLPTLTKFKKTSQDNIAFEVWFNKNMTKGSQHPTILINNRTDKHRGEQTCNAKY